MATQAQWNMEVEYIQSCNCDYGCACNFNGYPDKGHCEAFNGFRIRKGTFGNVVLDGVTFAMGGWWPKAIHEGNGTGRLYVDSRATGAQTKALEEIFQGKHGGGVWEVFPKTWSKILPTKRAKIDWNYGDYVASFKVEGVGEVQSDYILNPVTGEKFEGEVVLPKGFNWRRALVSRIKKLALHDADFQFDHKDTAGFTTIIKFTEKGPV